MFYNSITPLFIAYVLGAVADFNVQKDIPDTFLLLKEPHLQTDAFRNRTTFAYQFQCVLEPLLLG